MTHAANTCNIIFTLKKEKDGLLRRVARFFARMFETNPDTLYYLPPHIAARLYL